MTTSDDLILTDLSDRILTIRINRPAKKNALTLAMYAGITAALNPAALLASPRATI